MDDTTEKLIAAGYIRRVGNELELTDKGRAAIRVSIAKPVATSYGQPVGIGHQTVIDSPKARAKPHIRKKHKRKKR